jgi:Helix-turn-helix domain
MINRSVVIAELLADPSLVSALVPREDAVSLLIDLARVTRALELHVTAPMVPPPPAPPEGHLLTPDEAADIARVSRETIYGWSRRADWRPFARRVSRKVLRIQEHGFRRWLERRCSASDLASPRG